MGIRAVRVGLLVALAMGAASAHAQQPRTVATLKDVQGHVLVSQGDALVACANGQRLPLGTRVVTTGSAKALINYDAGCDVRLDENSQFTLRLGECPALLAQVVPLGPAAGAIGGGASASAVLAGVGVTDTAIGLLGPIGIGAAGYGAYKTFKTNAVSPN